MIERVLILTGVLHGLLSSFCGKHELFYNSRKRPYTIKILIDMVIVGTVIESPVAYSLIYQEHLKLSVRGQLLVNGVLIRINLRYAATRY